MKITVAGNKKEYEDGITVAELIVKENVENPEYVTVTAVSYTHLRAHET